VVAPVCAGMALRRRPRWTAMNVATIGAIDGNIIAAIITTHVMMKKANVPSALPGPAFIPDIRRLETNHATAANTTRVK
jgi:hypothetical protein